LEGETTLVGDILEMDKSPEYFSSGNLAQNLSEEAKEHHPLDTSFLV
jgi:hypothetical protein